MKYIKNKVKFLGAVLFIFVLGLKGIFVVIGGGLVSAKSSLTQEYIQKSDLDFSLESSCTNPVLGEKFFVDLNVIPAKNINLAVFRLKLNFDSSKLKYTGIYSSYGKDNFKVDLENNNLTVIFLTNEKGIDLTENANDTLLEFEFKVLSNASPGTVSFDSKIDGIANYDVERLTLKNDNLKTSVEIEKSQKVNCNLRLLSAENFSLDPAFSSEITQYYVTVPYNKSNLYILALPEDSRSRVDINRNSLNSEGKTTDIKITVTGYDNKSRKVYKVRVNRLKKKEKNYIWNGSDKNWLSKGMSINGNESGGDNGSYLEIIDIIGIEFDPTFFISVSLFCIFLLFLIIKRKYSE